MLNIDGVTATAINKRNLNSSVGDEAEEKKKAQMRKANPGYMITAKTQEILNDFYVSIRELTDQMCREEEHKGPNRFAFDGTSFALGRAFEALDCLKQFREQLIFVRLKYPDHDYREGLNGEAISIAVNKPDPSVSPGEEEQEKRVEEIRKTIPGFKITTRAQEVLDDWYETSRTLSRHIWREEDQGINQIGYDDFFFAVQHSVAKYQPLRRFKGQMIFHPLENPHHKQAESSENDPERRA
ncbi:hypothetical protein BDW74DRAFT_175694 [Aspergillus multicolor]|uniref:uncharacterized protein n=1 Tax=Aspergillus multicolor TaxID=41759 RepID=UPI003CCD81DE